VRQEAEPATDEVTEVAPGVLRMQLPIDMPGLGHVNTYALVDDRGAALVDPGVPGEASWDALLVRLKKAGIPLERVHTSIITHSHFDHFGGAAQLAEEAGAAIVAHEVFSTWGDDIECTDPTHDHGDPALLPTREFTGKSPWGTPSHMPDPKHLEEFRTKQGRGRQPFAVPHVTKRVRHGDVLRLAGRDWFVKHTPGHTIDHLCFHDPEGEVLLSGDHVLPTITPHIGGATTGDPLEDFFASLEAIGRTEHVQTILPAHGHPFQDLPGRVKSIHEHHMERLEKLREIAGELETDDGWASVVEFSHRLFRERSWGPMAESETWAHLEHLRLTGRAEQRWGADGLLEYLVS
jgi:glyoxylase-like metal-dependent hydrolase (beta-lactamase superfamily II)